MRQNIWFPLILLIVFWLVGIGGAFAGAVYSASSTSTHPVPVTTATITTTITTTQSGTKSTAITTTSLPVTTTTTSPITTTSATTITTTTTPVALNGQTIFNANCLSCHRSQPPTSTFTSAQLTSFISGHNSGRNLTKEQVAAIVAFLKP